MPLGEVVYRSIRRAIISGQLPQGASISETQIAQSLGVSKTPVREALRRLGQEGLLVGLPHRGGKVAFLSVADVEEIYEMRALLEGLAAQRAAERATGDDAESLTALMARLSDATERADTGVLRQLGAEFHSLVWQIARAKYLARGLKQLYDYIEMYRSAILDRPAGLEATHEHHVAIAGAILARDPDRAARAMRTHIRASLESVKARGVTGWP